MATVSEKIITILYSIFTGMWNVPLIQGWMLIVALAGCISLVVMLFPRRRG